MIDLLSRFFERRAVKAPRRSRTHAVRAPCLTNRIGYLLKVGLDYLTLERQGRTLSGGEAQRIHLANALGSLLTGRLYSLDERLNLRLDRMRAIPAGRSMFCAVCAISATPWSSTIRLSSPLRTTLSNWDRAVAARAAA